MATLLHSKTADQKESIMGSIQEIRPATPEVASPAVTAEKWVDGDVVAQHLGFSRNHIIRLARIGEIRGRNLGHGKKQYWRFRLSEVDQDIDRMHKANERTA